MSISQNYQSISPSLNLNFAKSKVLDPRITFTRTTTGTVLNERGVIETIPAGSPRFDHEFDLTTGSIRSLGLLIEEGRTNLLSRSEELDNNSTWATDNAGLTITANSVISPDGTQDADTLTEANTNTTHNRYQSTGLLSNTTPYTFSTFIKANTVTRVRLGLGYAGLGGGGWAIFNLSTGTVALTELSNSEPGSNLSASMIPYPNGWYRCVLTLTPSRNNLMYYSVITLINSSNAEIYQGNTANNLYAWGAQLEAGAFATSYIPSVASTVSRNPDNAFISGTNFSNWYNEPEGTIFVNYRVRPGKSSAYDRIYSINLNSTSGVEEISLVNNVGYSTQRIGYIVYDSSSAIQDSTGTNNGFETLSSNNVKTGMWYKSGNYVYSFGSASNVITGSSAGIPSPNTLDIGRLGAGSYLNGTMSQFVYYPRVFTSYSHLERLTK